MNFMKIFYLFPCIIFLIFLILFFMYPSSIFEGLQEKGIDMSAKNTTYDISNVERIYHPTYIDTTVNGNLVFPTFYTPGSYKYTSKSYIPNYTDSVYLGTLVQYTPILQELKEND